MLAQGVRVSAAPTPQVIIFNLYNFNVLFLRVYDKPDSIDEGQAETQEGGKGK